MVFLFNGGDCDQSFNVQADKFFCNDFNGGPPTERGEKAYIVVTDIKEQGIIYYDDWATVGETFTLSDGGNNFQADQFITIYSSDDTSDPANILQAIQYHSSCSSNLFLKDRFGATQLVIWINEEQGVVSCFANQTFDLDITIPIDIVGGPATITSLTVASNIDPFFFNLTDKVAGIEADAGDTLSVSIAVPIDLTAKQTYNLLVTVMALTQLGQTCRATDLVTFTAGYPLSPIFPTFAPTSAPSAPSASSAASPSTPVDMQPSVPSGTSSPNADSGASTCSLQAGISCQSGSGTPCENLQPPAATVCESESPATSVSFLYTGNSCGSTAFCDDTVEGQSITDDSVFVTMLGNEGRFFFSGTVQPNDVVTISSDLDRTIAITISDVDATTGGRGDELYQVTRMWSRCNGEDNDLTLGADYGAFQLVSFSNPDQGTQNALEELKLTYSITNARALDATVTSAVKTQPVTTELLSEGDVVLEGGDLIEFLDTVNVNMIASSGGELRYDFFVAGRDTESSGECFDDESFVVTL